MGANKSFLIIFSFYIFVQMGSFEDAQNCLDCSQLLDSIQSSFSSSVFERMTRYSVAQKICFQGNFKDEKCYENIKIMTPQFLNLLLSTLNLLKNESCGQQSNLNLTSLFNQNLNSLNPSEKLNLSFLNSNINYQNNVSISNLDKNLNLSQDQVQYSNEMSNSRNLYLNTNFVSSQILNSSPNLSLDFNKFNENYISFQANLLLLNQNQNQNQSMRNNNLNAQNSYQPQNVNPMQCINTSANGQGHKLGSNLSVQDLACAFCQYLAIEIKNGKTCQQTCDEFPMTQMCNQFCQQDLQLFSRFSRSPIQTCINLSVCTISHENNIQEEQK